MNPNPLGILPHAFAGEFWTPDTDFGADVRVVPNKRTPWTADLAGRALADGYKLLTGSRPSPAVLGLLLAQWALETGNGIYTHNDNPGNVKYYPGAPAKVFFRCSEVDGGVEVFFDPPAAQCAFAAYDSPAQGARDYIRILKKRPHWWAGLQSGDVATFNAALSTAPVYYTASPARYLGLLQDRGKAYASVARKYGRTWFGALLTYAGLAVLAGGGVVAYKRFR